MEESSIPESYEGKSVSTILSKGFQYATSLKKIVIPSGVTNIGNSAFKDCQALSAVYFGGSEEEWTKIKKGTSNFPLPEATVWFYSETKPTINGYYWHYLNGNPVCW